MSTTQFATYDENGNFLYTFQEKEDFLTRVPPAIDKNGVPQTVKIEPLKVEIDEDTQDKIIARDGKEVAVAVSKETADERKARKLEAKEKATAARQLEAKVVAAEDRIAAGQSTTAAQQDELWKFVISLYRERHPFVPEVVEEPAILPIAEEPETQSAKK